MVVELVGRTADVEALRRHLPPEWLVRHVAAARGARGWADAIVLVRPPVARVRRTRFAHPVTPIITVIDAYDPVRRVVDLIEAGADACVRAGRPELLVDQLRDLLPRPQRRWLAA